MLLVVPGCPLREHPSDPPSSPPPALHETAAVTLDELCAEPLRAWDVLDADGSPLAVTRGVCLGRVEHPDDGLLWQLVAQLQSLDATRPSWELHTWVDAQGRPRHAEFRTPELVTRFEWRADALIVRRLGDQLEIDGGGDLWITPIHGVYLRELMLRLGVGFGVGDGVGVERQRSLVPELETITEIELALERLDGDRAQARAGASTLALEGADAGLAGLRLVTVLVDAAPRYRPRADDRLGEFLPAVPIPRYLAPDDLQIEALEILGSPTLAGELVSMPDAAGRRPAALFLAGAGPQDRYGFVPESSVDLGSHELHDALARAGFVVLRFDDRGVGASELGEDPTPGFTALVDDARRALATLASRPEVDPNRIVVIGHGEGALHASILAGEGVRVGKRQQAIAGVVLLAAPGRNLRELVYDEIRASLAGHREGEIRAAVQRAQQVHDAALAGDELPASSEAARRWMVEAFTEDPLARLARVRAPILALQGGKDFQVSPERDFEPIRALLEQRRANGSAAELFADLDHLFKLEVGVSTPGHYADLRRRVDRRVIDRVCAWALAL